MDLIRLNRSTFIEEALIEGYSSLIWTERFIDPGEFELKTSLVLQTKALLPEYSLVSIRDSREVMIVEEHSIEIDDEGNAILTITGQSFVAFTKHRVIPGISGGSFPMATNYNELQGALIILWNALVNTSATDYLYHNPNDGLPYLGRTPYDAILNVCITSSRSVVGSEGEGAGTETILLTGGEVLPQVLALLKKGAVGVRSVRPPDYTVPPAYTVDPYGYVYEDGVGYDTRLWMLAIDLYRGINRSEDIIFHVDSGHVEKPSYFYNFAAYKNCWYVLSTISRKAVYRTNPGPTLRGLDLRWGHTDAGQPAEGVSASAFGAGLVPIGKRELAKAPKKIVFDSEVSQNIPYVYKQDYDLGDSITVLGQYGFSQVMQVAEYIRSENSLGETAYPTLVVDFNDN